MSAKNDRVYNLPDPELRLYDHGVGTLRVEGELVGHLASIVGELELPTPEPWPLFVVVWADGTKEPPFEDYAPEWSTVRELDAGYLHHFGPSVLKQRRFLWKTTRYLEGGPPCVYTFEWLPHDQAIVAWAELGLIDSDF